MAAYSLVQSNKGNATGNNAVSATFTSTATAGNLLIAAVATAANSTATITGFTALTKAGAGGGTARSLVILWKISDGTETTITTNTMNTSKAMAIAEFTVTGWKIAASPVAVENSQTTSAGTTHTTPTVTPVGANDQGMVVFATMALDGSTWSNGKYNTSTTGVNNVNGDVSGTACSVRLFDHFNNVSGNNNASADSSGSVTGCAAIAVFKLPGKGSFLFAN